MNCDGTRSHVLLVLAMVSTNDESAQVLMLGTPKPTLLLGEPDRFLVWSRLLTTKHVALMTTN